MSLQTLGNWVLVMFSVAGITWFLLNEAAKRMQAPSQRRDAVLVWRKRAGRGMALALLVFGVDAYLIHRSQTT